MLGVIWSHSHIRVCYLCEVPFQAKHLYLLEVFLYLPRCIIKTSVFAVITTILFGATSYPK